MTAATPNYPTTNKQAILFSIFEAVFALVFRNVNVFSCFCFCFFSSVTSSLDLCRLEQTLLAESRPDCYVELGLPCLVRLDLCLCWVGGSLCRISHKYLVTKHCVSHTNTWLQNIDVSDTNALITKHCHVSHKCPDYKSFAVIFKQIS